MRFTIQSFTSTANRGRPSGRVLGRRSRISTEFEICSKQSKSLTWLVTSRHSKMTSQIMLLNVHTGLKAKDVPRYTSLSSIDVINGSCSFLLWFPAFPYCGCVGVRVAAAENLICFALLLLIGTWPAPSNGAGMPCICLEKNLAAWATKMKFKSLNEMKKV